MIKKSLFVLVAVLLAGAGCPTRKNSPKSPPEFVIGSGSASVKLSWDPNQEKNVVGYKIYHMTPPGTYGNPLVVGKDTTQIEIKGLDKGRRYYFKISAYNDRDQESELSGEVSKIAE